MWFRGPQALADSYFITITGTDANNLSHSATVTLTVVN